MAVLCRCKAHQPANNRIHIYTHYGVPVGYPNSSSICGTTGCNKVGYIYMTEDEVVNYNTIHKRIFNYANNGTKVKIEDILPAAI